MIIEKEIVHEPRGIDRRHMSSRILKASPFINAYVKQGGYGVLTDDFWVCRPANRGFHVFVYTFSGKGKVVMEDGTEIELERGKLFISWATGQGHYEATEKNGLWDMFWLSFWDQSANFSQFEDDYSVLDFSDIDEMKSLVLNIFKEEIYQDSKSNRALELYEQLLLIQMERSIPVSENLRLRKHRKEFLELFQRVSQTLDRKWTIKELCDESGYSRTHFTRLCLNLYGKNPAKIIREMRMEQAKVLLLNSGQTIGRVAESVGFQYISDFSIAFKNEFGVSPKEYRKTNGEGLKY